MQRIPLGKIAGSAAIIENGKILLIKRSDTVSTYPGYWTFPSGGVEETDKTIQDTVIREVKEEVGLLFAPQNKFGFYENISNGKRYFSLVHLGKWSGKITLQKEEASQWNFFSYSETKGIKIAFAYRDTLQDLLKAGYIK